MISLKYRHKIWIPHKNLPRPDKMSTDKKWLEDVSEDNWQELRRVEWVEWSMSRKPRWKMQADRWKPLLITRRTVGGEIRAERCCERLCTQDWTWNSQWEAAIREGNDNVDGDNVISLSSHDLATDPSHSTHHTAYLSLKQQRPCHQLSLAAIAWEVLKIAPNWTSDIIE